MLTVFTFFNSCLAVKWGNELSLSGNSLVITNIKEEHIKTFVCKVKTGDSYKSVAIFKLIKLSGKCANKLACLLQSCHLPFFQHFNFAELYSQIEVEIVNYLQNYKFKKKKKSNLEYVFNLI